MTDPTPQLLAAEQIYFSHKAKGIVGNPRPMLAEVLASKWLPIESAPVDGTTVLLHGPGWLASTCGEWTDFGDGGDCGWAECGIGVYPQPTHWQPLPLPPTSEEGE